MRSLLQLRRQAGSGDCAQTRCLVAWVGARKAPAKALRSTKDEGLAAADERLVRHAQHPTLQLIARRKANCLDQPGRRGDPYKLGLVVEGGGMRGVISGAMLMGLRALGLHNTFDAVYGASAGAINATYFLTNQPHGLDIYAEDLVDGRFLDPSAMFFPSALRALVSSSPSRPAMDLAFLLGHVMRSVKPLDLAAVINSPVPLKPLDLAAVINCPVPLKIVASSLDALRPIILSDFTSETDLLECLAASATIPEVVGPPRLVRGHRCVDAAVFEPVPVASALRDGCTHVLVLCTRTAAKVTGTNAPMYHAATAAVEHAVRNTFLHGGYMEDAWRCAHSNRGCLDDDALYDAFHGCFTQSHLNFGGHVLPLHPASQRGVHPVCTDPRKLNAARVEGYHTIERLVGRPLGLTFQAGSCAEAYMTRHAKGVEQLGAESGGDGGVWS
ncbi:hypothetical protein FOA52_013392 [Chlamydomonas sp. UWO 241]|nr:hypothetical protein FOA52_013392 [Chlamydomonas sp. UWO 241]